MKHAKPFNFFFNPKKKNTRNPKRHYFFEEFYVAGYRHYDGHQLEENILEGKTVDFKREPQNPHDPKAVELYLGRRKLGYIPQTENKAIAKLLDQGVRVRGVIGKRNYDDRPNKKIKITPFKETTH